MDQAWAMEQQFWQMLLDGEGSGFYRKYMAADGFVVLPNRIVSRNELVADWDDRPIDSYALSEPAFTLIEGGNVVLTYEVQVQAEWLPDYRCFMTALFAPGAAGWTLVFRAHTPRGEFPF